MPLGVEDPRDVSRPARGYVAFDPVSGDRACIVRLDALAGALRIQTMDRDRLVVEMGDREARDRTRAPDAQSLIALEAPIGTAVGVLAHGDKPWHGRGWRRARRSLSSMRLACERNVDHQERSENETMCDPQERPSRYLSFADNYKSVLRRIRNHLPLDWPRQSTANDLRPASSWSADECERKWYGLHRPARRMMIFVPLKLPFLQEVCLGSRARSDRVRRPWGHPRPVPHHRPPRILSERARRQHQFTCPRRPAGGMTGAQTSRDTSRPDTYTASLRSCSARRAAPSRRSRSRAA